MDPSSQEDLHCYGQTALIYPVSHYRSVFLNYVIHQWVAHFGALPLPSAPVVDDAPDAVADGLGVAWFPAQRPVQCQA